jgi:ribosomal protein S24E
MYHGNLPSNIKVVKKPALLTGEDTKVTVAANLSISMKMDGSKPISKEIVAEKLAKMMDADPEKVYGLMDGFSINKG